MPDDLLAVRLPITTFYVLRDEAGLYPIDTGFVSGRMPLNRGCGCELLSPVGLGGGHWPTSPTGGSGCCVLSALFPASNASRTCFRCSTNWK